MDIFSLVGLVMGFGAIVLTMTVDGGNLASLLQLSAVIIVGGGTIGAVLLQTPLSVFFRGCKMLGWVFFPPKDDREELVQKILEWLRIARRQFILALDPVAEQQSDPFVRQGLRLVVDGIDASQIRILLESVIATQEHEEMVASEIFEAMGGYAPTVGILGAVMGLITVMSHLEDPDQARERYCHGLCRHRVRRWCSKPRLLTDWQQTEGSRASSHASAGNDHRSNGRDRDYGAADAV